MRHGRRATARGVAPVSRREFSHSCVARGLQDKLQAARSNNRFLDKRIAGLEAELLGLQAGADR